MKRIIFILLCSLIARSGNIQANELPEFVRHRLDSIQKETKKSLERYRVWNFQTDGYKTLPFAAGDSFSWEERLLIDSLGLNLNVGMIYNQDMRYRIEQLIRNEYPVWELDSLVNQQMEYHITSNEREARKICKFDTLQVFRTTLDSFYIDIKNKNPKDSILRKYEYVEKYKYEYVIFKMLQLDTTTTFKQSYNKILERERKRIREYYISGEAYFNYIHLAELCGYIGDKRFVQPLIELLCKSEEYQQERIVESLVRMRVEPYYSDYVKKRTLPKEQIMEEKQWLSFKLEDFVNVLGTQEAFLELSKYLLSNKRYEQTIIDSSPEPVYSPVSSEAFFLIRDNIENEEVRKIMKDKNSYSNPLILRQTYDWMQKNYGKYKIRRIW